MTNINKATREQLIALKGIGPKVADRIIEYRNKLAGRQDFKDVYELSAIKGLGKKRIDHLIATGAIGV